MKEKGKKLMLSGIICIVLFVIWTLLIQIVDVKPLGQNGTNIGLSTFNCWFHKLTGVHMSIYVITDWFGLVPIFVCIAFCVVGIIQLIKRKSLFKMDSDIILLGIYYVLVIFGYLIFEMIPINYRPILIEGVMEASYPSSTTLLVLSVMPTVVLQANRRLKNAVVKKIICIITVAFSLFMVIGRLVSGVHWFSDIVGGVMLSAGLFLVYKASILLVSKE